MRKPDELTREQLLQLVIGVQHQLYLEVDTQGSATWNPGKEWQAAEICDQLAQLLSDQGLVPRSRELFRLADASAAD
jgi:hypothetical protein